LRRALVLLPLLLAARSFAAEPPAVLLSRQLAESQHLKVGDTVSFSGDPSGAGPRTFRVAGVYEPVADPRRLGEVRLEARLHLPDFLGLTADSDDAAGRESVGAVNVALIDPKDAQGFARDLTARMPGIVARPTAGDDEKDPFVVLDRFHLAIAVVTVIASSLFLLALMVMLVDERRATVGTLRLIGLRRHRILLLVLTEGVLIAVLGAAAGVLLALGLESVINRFFQWRYETSLVFVRITPTVAARSVWLAVPLGVTATLASSWGLLRRGALTLARR
jgi:putative ABC transport system permease protein